MADNMKIAFQILATILATSWGDGVDITSRIIGGERTTVENYPFIVSLRISNEEREMHLCGGSLISNQWVVTAAHCMASGRINKVVGGAERSDRPGGISSNIAQSITHEGYNAEQHENDIALIKLETPFTKSSKIQYIKMEENFIDQERDCVTIGWGKEYDGMVPPSRYLKFLNEKTVPQAACSQDDVFYLLKKQDRFITDFDLCTLGQKEGERPCEGDSGGPVVVGSRGNYTLIGTVSLGINCYFNAADLNARISAYREWIREKSGI